MNDTNIRIDRADYKRLKITAAKSGLTLKEVIHLYAKAALPKG